jgi:hypothetical protein
VAHQQPLLSLARARLPRSSSTRGARALLAQRTCVPEQVWPAASRHAHCPDRSSLSARAAHTSALAASPLHSPPGRRLGTPPASTAAATAAATGVLCRSAPPRTRASCQPRHARAATTTDPLQRFHCAHTRIHPHASRQATASSSRSTCSSRCALQCAGPAPHAIARHAIGPCCRMLRASRGQGARDKTHCPDRLIALPSARHVAPGQTRRTHARLPPLLADPPPPTPPQSCPIVAVSMAPLALPLVRSPWYFIEHRICARLLRPPCLNPSSNHFSAKARHLLAPSPLPNVHPSRRSSRFPLV